MVQLSATRCSCIAILWVSLLSFAAITLCVASQRVFVVVYFVIDSVRKLLDTHAYCFPVDDTCTCTRPVLQMLPLISTLYDSHQRLSSFLGPSTTPPPPPLSSKQVGCRTEPTAMSCHWPLIQSSIVECHKSYGIWFHVYLMIKGGDDWQNSEIHRISLYSARIWKWIELATSDSARLWSYTL
jgi:hypothetical protein